MQYIGLTQGYVAAVDQADYERVSALKWRAQVKRRADGSVRVYAVRSVPREGCGQTSQMLHRFILDTPDGMYTDHTNGNGLDNRRANLRICTNAQNLRNRRQQGGTSKFKGVWWDNGAGRWQASVRLDGKARHLGRFTSERDAARAYDVAAQELHGEFAKTNASMVAL